MRKTSNVLCLIISSLSLSLNGCSAKVQSQEEIQAARYHLPSDRKVLNIDANSIPDAVPRAAEGQVKAAPYTFNKVRYVPLKSAAGYQETGTASWYGAKFHGYHTANGEIYDMYAMTAAHKTLPLPSYARVTNLKNGRSVIVRINDRGPFHGDRVIDLSWAAATKLGYGENGIGQVKIEGIDTSPAGLRAFYQKNGTPVNGKMYLQIAALSSRERAVTLQKELQKASLNQPVQVLSTGNVHRVRIGPLGTNQQLLNVQTRLASLPYGAGQKVFD